PGTGGPGTGAGNDRGAQDRAPALRLSRRTSRRCQCACPGHRAAVAVCAIGRRCAGSGGNQPFRRAAGWPGRVRAGRGAADARGTRAGLAIPTTDRTGFTTMSKAGSRRASAVAHDAEQAVIATLPIFEMARMRATNTARRHPVQGFAGDSPASRMRWVNQFTHTRRLRGPEDREVVTPNNDTLFTNAWLDLSAGPLVLDLPEMGDRYWVLGFLDAWTNPWAYAGRRTTGGKAQRLFVHGPDWTGDVPAGMHPIVAPSDDVWVIGRILVDADPADLARVHALQDQLAIRRPDGTPALPRIDALLDKRDPGVPAPGQPLRV